MITVLVVDDQALIRQAVTDILSAEEDISVVGEAMNGADAVHLAGSLHPDIVLMDIRMPELDGIAATATISADPALHNTQVLILTTFEEDEYLIAALRAGASGFIGKGAEPDEIARAVRSIHAGEALLSPIATRNLISRFVLAPSPSSAGPNLSPPGFDQLTERELEVLKLVGQGHSNQRIADELVISPHTAKTHVNRIMAKLYAHDRAQLVINAYETGLITPGTSGNH